MSVGKEEQRNRKGLKTLFIIDFLIVIVPIIFFLVVKTSFAFGVLTNDTEYSDVRYENVYIDLAEEGEEMLLTLDIPYRNSMKSFRTSMNLGTE